MAVSLKHVKEVSIMFYSFDPAARFCREMMRQVSTSKAQASNSKLKVICQVMSEPVEPIVNVKFGGF